MIPAVCIDLHLAVVPQLVHSKVKMMVVHPSCVTNYEVKALYTLKCFGWGLHPKVVIYRRFKLIVHTVKFSEN